MTTVDAAASLRLLSEARHLVDAGRYAAMVAFAESLPPEQVRQSPTLALLLGIAHSRLGRPVPAKRWALRALALAGERGDRAVEARALNVCGAIELARGEVAKAEEFFNRALAEADRLGDHATVGRCSNNLGIIANLRGEHGQALGWHTMALAAFERAGWPKGAAEALHNLAHVHKDRGHWEAALQAADRAVEEAERAGDRALLAAARCGHADIQRLSGFAAAARREVEWALAVHRELGDRLGEAEDLRVLAGVRGALGEKAEAERMYRDVVERAEQGADPLLAAHAARDLALLLAGWDRRPEATEWANRARAGFASLGAVAEIRHLDAALLPLRLAAVTRG